MSMTRFGLNDCINMVMYDSIFQIIDQIFQQLDEDNNGYCTDLDLLEFPGIDMCSMLLLTAFLNFRSFLASILSYSKRISFLMYSCKDYLSGFQVHNKRLKRTWNEQYTVSVSYLSS